MANEYVTKTKEIGVASDSNPSWGIRADEFLPDLRGLRGIKRYREMAENDSTIGAILAAMTLMVRATKWRIEEGSEEARELVEWSLYNMEDATFQEFIAEVLTFLPYGFSVHEIVARPANKHPKGWVTLRKLAPRAQWTIDRFDADENGNIKGVYQYAAQRSSYIPYGKLLHFRTTSASGDPAGRALDPMTPIITPDGWRVMDDLKAGDKVFDEKGRIRYVTARKDWKDRPCYEIAFSSGETIIADANHQWEVVDGKKRGKEKGVPVLMTTQEILDAGVYWGAEGSTHANTSRWSVPWCAPLDFPEQHLPLDPYYFGYWLGDGNTRNSSITTHEDDVDDLLKHVHAAGFTTTVVQNGVEGGKGRVVRVQGSGKWAADAPGRALHVMGVTKGKFIPENYLRGSYEQRLALMQGLMDSDGYTDDFGRCEFTNTNKNLADGVAQLLRSLGIGARVTEGLNDRGNPKYRVSFTPTQAVFRLPRKQARVKDVRAREAHYIRSIKPATARRTVCIEVDGPSHLFLCGASMIPTHNSVLRSAYESWYFARRIREIEAVAIERELNGVPLLKMPAEYLSADATPAQKQTVEAFKRIGRDLKNNEMGFALIPSDPYMNDDGSYTDVPMMSLELIASEGKRDINTNEVILRYEGSMARSALADFVTLGSNDRGSFALSKSKSDLFLTALTGYLDNIAAILNRKLIPTLCGWNGIKEADYPTVTHGTVAPTDLGELGEFLRRLTLAGFDFRQDPKTEAYLREISGLPPMSEGSGEKLDGKKDPPETELEDPAVAREREAERQAAIQARRRDAARKSPLTAAGADDGEDPAGEPA